MKNRPMQINKCDECYENAMKLFPLPQKILASKVDEYLGEISFPFQAIGLLIDNCRLGYS